LATRKRRADDRTSVSFPRLSFGTGLRQRRQRFAEETWHHPELTLGWGFCEVCLTTRKIGGLHEFDFVMAARIDMLAADEACIAAAVANIVEPARRPRASASDAAERLDEGEFLCHTS
jgi:pterin-4a-carbinolamine dehydratase